MPNLEITEVVLVHCNIVINDYQQESRVLYTLLPGNSFGQLLGISPENFTFLKIFNSKCSYTEVLFTDQNSKTLEVVDKINISIQLNLQIEYL